MDFIVQIQLAEGEIVLGNKSNNLFNNLDTLKEYRWVLPLVFLILTISENFIKSIIGSFTYNIIIICVMTILGIYILHQLIEYIKNNNYDIKNMKRELVCYFLMILFTITYLASLLII